MDTPPPELFGTASPHWLGVRDGLTGLPGRPALMKRMRLAEGADGPAALLLLTIDRFAALIDRHGPAVANTVLRHTAARLRSQVPDDALLVRLNHDELTLLLPDSQPDQAALVTIRLTATCATPFLRSGYYRLVECKRRHRGRAQFRARP